MSTVSDLIVFLEKFAPPELAEDWDNTGLLIGRRDRLVHRAMTCLTLTPDVAAEAMTENVDLVVSHHPVLFRGAKQVTDMTSEGKMLLDLIESRVAVYSPHTSFDSSPSGINQQLAESVGLKDILALRPSDSDETSGSGRYGVLPETLALSDFLSVVREATAAEYLEFCGDEGASVTKVAVACGAAGEFLSDAIQAGCDTFVTGEGRFHSALEARNAGVALVFVGHYSSERPAVEKLARTLGAEFSDIEVFSSRCERDPLAVFSS